MSVIDGAESVVQDQFSGADQLSDTVDIQFPACISLQNSEFVGNAPRTRRGFGVQYTFAKAIATMWSWIQESFERLIWLDVTGTPAVISTDLTTNASSNIITSGLGSAKGMTNAAVGFREIMTFYDANGLATTTGRIWDGTFNGPNANVESLFPRTLKTTEVTFAFTEPGAGSVTAGSHTFAIAITTWNGGQAPPGPWSGAAILVPQVFVSAGAKNLNVQLTPATTWPMWVNQIQLMMTPNVNPNNWFLVPGAITIVPRGTSTPVNILIDISDLALAAKGTNVTVSGTTPSIFDLYSQDPNGNGPFNPHVVLPFGQRMVYITRLPSPDSLATQGAIFVSEASKPQFITLQFHLLSLPEFLDTVTATVLRNTLYVFGEDWTFSYSDNTRYPVQWAPTTPISRNIGSPFIKGVLAIPVRGIIWVASKVGLFAMNGTSYDLRPSSYSQGAADWQSINFTAATLGGANALQIVDDPLNRLIIVMAPIGPGQLTANSMLVWDYSLGFDADSIRYCGKWWLNTPAGVQIGIGAIALIHSHNQYDELWLSTNSSTVTGKIYRQKHLPTDATAADLTPLFSDDTAGIDHKYRTTTLVEIEEAWYQNIGATLRMPGSGLISVTAYGLDQYNPVPLRQILASPQPGTTYFVAADLQGKAIYYEIDNGAVAGAYFWLTKIKHWFNKWLTQGDS